MPARVFAATLVAAIFLTSLAPQTAPGQQSSVAVQDADRQLAALRAERAGATTLRLWDIDSRILRLLVDHFPTRTAEIDQAIQALGSRGMFPPSSHVSMLAGVVEPAVDKRLALRTIEQTMTRALAAVARDEIAAGLRRTAASQGRPVIDAAVDAEYLSVRVQALGVLGRVHVELGEVEKAEADLREAVGLLPLFATARVGLAELERRRGNDRAALDHYFVAHLGANAPNVDADARMKALYRKLNNGDEAGLLEAAERAYAAAARNPIAVTRYVPPAAPTGRVALLELFTGSGCFPCVPADLAFDAVLERYPAGTIAPLVYHLHAPQPDPMAIAVGSARMARLISRPSGGVPQFYVDGIHENPGGGNWLRATAKYEQYRDAIDRALRAAPDAFVSVRASLDHNRVRVTTTLAAPAVTSGLRLHVVLAERQLHFHGENGIHTHAMVVRAVDADAAEGQPVALGPASTTIATTFDLDAIASAVAASLASNISSRRARENAATPATYKAEGRALTSISSGNLVVVAFVSAPDKRVLQAAAAGVR
jgi:tetratricopeptide (TPR) repeat protein